MHRDHAIVIGAGVDGIGEQVDDHLVNPGGPAPDRRHGPQFHGHPNPFLAGVALDHVDRRFDAGVEVDLVPVSLVDPGEEPQLLDDPLDPTQALPGALGQPGQIRQAVAQVDPVIKGLDLRRQFGANLSERLVCLAIDFDQSQKSRRSRSRTATLLLTNESGLLISWATPATSCPRLAIFSVSTSRLWAFLSAWCAWCSEWASSWSSRFFSLSCFVGPDPRCHVPEDSLDTDGLAVVSVKRTLHHLDVKLVSLGSDVLFDHVEHLPALDHATIIAAVLLGQLTREEIEIGLAHDVLEAAPHLGAEALVREGEPAVEVLAEDHLGQSLDQRVVEDLRLPEGPHRLPSLVGRRFQVDGEVRVPLPHPPERDRRPGHEQNQAKQHADHDRVINPPHGGQRNRTGLEHDAKEWQLRRFRKKRRAAPCRSGRSSATLALL